MIYLCVARIDFEFHFDFWFSVVDTRLSVVSGDASRSTWLMKSFRDTPHSRPPCATLLIVKSNSLLWLCATTRRMRNAIIEMC